MKESRPERRRSPSGNAADAIGIVRESADKTRSGTQEALYRSILADLPDLICRWLPDGTITYVNDEYCRYFGRPCAELVGSNFMQLLPPSEWAAMKEHAAQLCKEHPTAVIEHKVIAGDGTVRWQRWTDRVLLDESGEVVGFQSTGADITQLKEQEEALRISEERFALAVAGSNDGIWDWDLANHRLYWSDRVFTLLGLAPGSVAPTPEFYEALIHPEDRAQAAILFGAHLGQGAPYRVEYRLRTGSGEYRWYLARGQAIRDEEGNPVRMAGSLTDIDARKRTEAHLKRLTRTHSTLNACNQLLIHAEEEQSLLEGFCRTVIGIGGYRFAVVGYLREQRIEPVAHAGYEDGFLQAMEPRLALDLAPTIPGMRAMLEGETAIIRDTDTEVDDPLWREAIRRGYRAIIGLPLTAKGSLFGLLVIIAEEPDAFDESEERMLLERLAADLAFGIHTLRIRAAQREAAAMLHLSNRAMEASLNAIMITDTLAPGSPLIYVNPAFEAITGYAAAEVLGRSPGFLHGDDSAQPALLEINAIVREQRTGSALLRNYRKDGTLFWNDLHISPVRDSEGRVTHFVGVINDVTEQQRYREQLEYQAQHDALTHLPNRNLLRDRLAQSLIFSGRHGRNSAVLFLDLDRFKLVNDSLGHPVGDSLLTQVAERLRQCARPGDTIARYGGDEFVIILSEVAEEEDVTRVAETIRHAVSAPFEMDGHLIQVTFSMGVSLYPRDGDNPDILLRNADTAMYQAKERGRNLVHFYTAELNRRMINRLTMEARLRRALDEGQLLLHYQPQIDLRTGRIAGMEALLRWNDPEHGMISPMEFIPLAEETGLIIPIGEWVLKTACEQGRRWATDGLRVRVAVNVSARQIERPDFAQVVGGAIKATGFEAALLELELTETAVMSNPDEMVKRLQEVKRHGCQIALDDFGTGYSSLAHLSRFVFDKLKIDQSFVREVAENPSDSAIAITIIGMARGLHLRVIAEGVENETQLRYLQRHGCDEVQGFHIGRPLPAEEASALLCSDWRLPSADGQVTPNQRTLVLVDDEPNITRALHRVLRRDGYRILAVNHPREVFDLLAKHRVQVIISDQRMPEMQGTELLARVKDLYPNVVRMILSGYTEVGTVTDAVNRGWIYKFLTKPWEEEELRRQVQDAFEQYERNTAVTEKE